MQLTGLKTDIYNQGKRLVDISIVDDNEETDGMALLDSMVRCHKRSCGEDEDIGKRKRNETAL